MRPRKKQKKKQEIVSTAEIRGMKVTSIKLEKKQVVIEGFRENLNRIERIVIMEAE